MAGKDQYLSDVGNQTDAQFRNFVTMSFIWTLGIPLVHGVLGSDADASLGLTIASVTLAFILLILGLTAINRYRLLSQNPPPDAQDTVVAQAENKQPFGFFLATVPVTLVAVLVGHVLILN